MLLGVGDVALDLVDRRRLDQRALLGARLEAGADLEPGNRGRELLGELVVDPLLDIDPVGADAGLAGVAELARDRALDRGVDVGVVEDDQGRWPPSSMLDLLDRVGALLEQDLADLGRAGEGELAHGIELLVELAADLPGTAGDDVEDALGDTGALAELGQRQRRDGVSSRA